MLLFVYYGGSGIVAPGGAVISYTWLHPKTSWTNLKKLLPKAIGVVG